jgi:transposase-like protein
MTRYTDAEKQEAVRLYVEVGTAEAARQTGASPRSVNAWAQAAGVTAQAKVEKTEAARQVLASQRAAQRENVRILYLDKIEACLEAINPAKPREAKDLMTTAAIGTDKFRLEMGEATELVITGDMMDQAIHNFRAELGEDDTL